MRMRFTPRVGRMFPVVSIWKALAREVAIVKNGDLTSGGGVNLTRDAVIAFGRKLRSDDEVVIEATVNTALAWRTGREFFDQSGPACVIGPSSGRGPA